MWVYFARSNWADETALSKLLDWWTPSQPLSGVGKPRQKHPPISTGQAGSAAGFKRSPLTPVASQVRGGIVLKQR
jgi:hypothetical protein